MCMFMCICMCMYIRIFNVTNICFFLLINSLILQTCKYVHYELDPTPDVSGLVMGASGIPPRKMLTKTTRVEYCSEVELGEPQWINCDIRSFRMDILGQFGVIMADPPWDIHMELPYGTMADDEMRNLNVPALQTDGLIFLWVTGRAMELGREWYFLAMIALFLIVLWFLGIAVFFQKI